MRESCGVGGRCAAARRRREGSHAHDTASATCVMSRGRGGAPRTPSGGMGGTRHKLQLCPRTPQLRLPDDQGTGSGHAAATIPDPSLKRQNPGGARHHPSKWVRFERRSRPVLFDRRMPILLLVFSLLFACSSSFALFPHIARPDLDKIDSCVEPPLVEDVFVCCTCFLRMYIHRVSSLQVYTGLHHRLTLWCPNDRSGPGLAAESTPSRRSRRGRRWAVPPL